MTISTNRPKVYGGGYDLRGSYRLVCSTGAVTTVAARTASAGQVFVFRWPDTSAAKCFVKYVGAKFFLSTAYGTAQETGVDMIMARSFTVSATGGTAVDVGSTVANTGNLMASQPTSLITANCVRVATTDAFTAGTHTLDANPIGILSAYSSAIGITVPTTGSGARDGFGTLWDATTTTHRAPLVLAQDEGFVIRNLILMGATGVGRWDFCVEWDEGTPQ